MKNTKIYWIDLFCGAGGTTSGIHLSGCNTEVLACVNHDKNAILSHQENHPKAHHFTEDIRDFQVVLKLKSLVDNIRKRESDVIINIWASLECTNFSKAKGGLPRDPDSRTLAEHMFMYLEELSPDYFFVENVREFLAWGPLDEKGKPISRKNGQDFIKWIEKINSYGYQYEYKILNAANYGARQSRERLFIQFSKPEFKIKWPIQTHAKNSDSLSPFKKWLPVKDILDLEDEGVSIFERKKSLCENTLKRIFAGLEKFVANGESVFTKRYNGGSPEEKLNSINKPLGTVLTNNTHAIVTAAHLNTYYGNGGIHSIELPSPTLTQKDRIAKVNVAFIDQQYGNSKPSSIEKPSGTLTQNPKFNLVNSRLHYLVNPQFDSKGKSIDEPCFTLIARMDKRPPSVVTVKEGNYMVNIFQDDSETMIQIKEFMAAYGIIDIKMRMLKIQELKQIQGFPKNYKLVGTLTEQKKYIGNAVEVNQAIALVKANYQIIHSR